MGVGSALPAVPGTIFGRRAIGEDDRKPPDPDSPSFARSLAGLGGAGRGPVSQPSRTPILRRVVLGDAGAGRCVVPGRDPEPRPAPGAEDAGPHHSDGRHRELSLGRPRRPLPRGRARAGPVRYPCRAAGRSRAGAGAQAGYHHREPCLAGLGHAARPARRAGRGWRRQSAACRRTAPQPGRWPARHWRPLGAAAPEAREAGGCRPRLGLRAAERRQYRRALRALRARLAARMVSRPSGRSRTGCRCTTGRWSPCRSSCCWRWGYSSSCA